MARYRVFVLGWYGHNNLGDEAFKDAFRRLWPNISFVFGDELSEEINTYDALWIGGGSFLDNKLVGLDSVNLQIPISFIGIGLNKSTRLENKALLLKAKKIIVRDSESTTFCPSAIVAPDLVFSLPRDPCLINLGKKQQVTILLNDFITPTNLSPEWVTFSYHRFINEFSEACNALIDLGYILHFIPMCTGNVDDRRLAANVIGRISNKDKAIWYLRPVTLTELMLQISLSEFVVTQRFHGIVLSTICGIPFVSIRAHDKLASLTKDMNWSADVNYYEFTKTRFSDVINNKFLDSKKFLIEYADARAMDWLCISATVTKELML